MSSAATITTPLTTLLNIQHPIVLAGMAMASNGCLVAAVSNAGGLGVIGSFRLSPEQLRAIIAETKENLKDPSLPFGIDVLLPQLGGQARKTNRDETNGKLEEIVDIVIESGAKLFVSAVGVPPRHVIDKLHSRSIFVMNMAGHPKHAAKALDLGVDMICAQGMEAGGHTGEIATSVLAPAVVDIAKLYRPRLLNGATALVLTAGGIYDGRGLAGALVQGASGVWVGTRFAASEESGSTDTYKQSVVECGFDETERTLILTGRPLRVRRNNYVRRWHQKMEHIQQLCEEGIIPVDHDRDHEASDVVLPHIMGQVAGAIKRIQSAEEIVHDMVKEAVSRLCEGASYITEPKYACNNSI